jgi:hypothetical protein
MRDEWLMLRNDHTDMGLSIYNFDFINIQTFTKL